MSDGTSRLYWAERISRWSILHPRATLAGFLLVTAGLAAGLLRLDVRTDGSALVPAGDPAVVADGEIRARFGLRDPVVVLLETGHPDGIYNHETLEKVERLSQALAALPQIGSENVQSLETEHQARNFPGTTRFRRFLEPLPQTAKELAELRREVDAVGLLTGTLVSADATATAILVGVPPATGGRQDDRTRLVNEITRIAAPFESGQERVSVVGAPVAEALLGSHILQDLTVLIPLAMLVIAGVLAWACRRTWGVVLGLAKVGGSIVATLGLMGWTGAPVYLTTAVLPVILITVGLADEVHIFWHYQLLLGRERQARHPDALLATMADMARPVMVTSLTTTCGFLSFLTSSLAPVVSFGLYGAFGAMFCVFWGLCATPAGLALTTPERFRRPGAPTAVSSERLARLLAPLLARPRSALLAMLAVSVLLGLGAFRLSVQDSWIDGFARSSRFHRETDRANQLLSGTHTLLIEVRFDPPEAEIPTTPVVRGPLLSQKALVAVGGLEDFLRTQPEVGGVLGPYGHLTTISFLTGGRLEMRRRIPEDPQWVHQLMNEMANVRGKARRHEVIADDLASGVVTVLLKNANYRDTETLMNAARSYAAEHLAPLHGSLRFGGDVAVSQAMIPAIVASQVRSILAALVGTLLAVAVPYRSLWVGLMAGLPTILAVGWTYGLMGWMGIPLGVATSMFCAITLGIGIDYGVHLLDRYRTLVREGRPDAAAAALVEAGPAIVYDCLAIALGFGILAFSQVPANRRLGLLVAIALGSSCVTTLAGLGPLLATRWRRGASSSSHL